MSHAEIAGFAGLRIALVGPLPPPSGGMANQTRQLAELLRAAGATVEMVQTNAAYRPAWAGRVPVMRAFFRLLPYLWALWRAAGRADVLHVMANSGWSWHLFAAPALWVAAWRGKPAVVNYRGGEAGDFLKKARETVARSMQHCRALIVPSGFLLEVFQQHGMRAEVVPNVIDLQRFHPAAEPKLGTAPQLLVARNLEALYDNASALRAFALVRAVHADARLTIAGTGPELQALQALTQSLGVSDAVHFAGRVERDDMAALLRASTVSLNPSLADNMPNSVLESLASGVPVVSTDVGGVPYLLRHEHSGLLVPPADPQAMAQAILRLLADPALYQALVQTGLQEAQRYTWPRVAPKLAEVYQRVLSAPATSPLLPSH